MWGGFFLCLLGRDSSLSLLFCFRLSAISFRCFREGEEREVLVILDGTEERRRCCLRCGAFPNILLVFGVTC